MTLMSRKGLRPYTQYEVCGKFFIRSATFSLLQCLNLSPPSQKIVNPKSATANKRKSNITDDKGFTHPSKSAKNLNSIFNSAPKIKTGNKFETLFEMSDTFEDIDNDSNIAPAETKPQPIFMKLSETFTEIISSLAN